MRVKADEICYFKELDDFCSDNMIRIIVYHSINLANKYIKFGYFSSINNTEEHIKFISMNFDTFEQNLQELYDSGSDTISYSKYKSFQDYLLYQLRSTIYFKIKSQYIEGSDYDTPYSKYINANKAKEYIIVRHYDQLLRINQIYRIYKAMNGKTFGDFIKTINIFSDVLGGNIKLNLERYSDSVFGKSKLESIILEIPLLSNLGGMNYIKANMKMLKDLAFGYLRDDPVFRSYNIPIVSLEIKNLIYTKDSVLIYTFGIILE